MAKKDIKTIAITMVLSQLLSPHFFHEMRTEKQYGYLVGVGYVPVGHYPGIALYIQSPHTTALELTEAIDNFTKNTANLMAEMSTQEWQQLQQGLAGQLQESDASLRIKSQRFWGAICNKDIQFNRKSQLIEQIKTLQLSDIITFINQALINTQKHDRIVLMSIKNDQAQQLLPQAHITTSKQMNISCPLKL